MVAFIAHDRLINLLAHVEGVQRDCQKIARKLILRGDFELGRALIANSFIHDQSKFSGIEWEYLNDVDCDRESAGFKRALDRHVTRNPHHPEAWFGGIHQMRKVYVYEMVADWHARSTEQGTCLIDYIEGKAMGRFSFTGADPVYDSIRDALDLLLEKPFK